MHFLCLTDKELLPRSPGAIYEHLAIQLHNKLQFWDLNYLCLLLTVRRFARIITQHQPLACYITVHHRRAHVTTFADIANLKHIVL